MVIGSDIRLDGAGFEFQSSSHYVNGLLGEKVYLSIAMGNQDKLCAMVWVATRLGSGNTEFKTGSQKINSN